ncbi:MAG: NADH-quinone oxidoreductase subunit L [Armatimonadetes bacterium]|nr:NADH-quinone oxidoreductase subunit L [Armatimonadota bacterium]
MFDPIWLVFFLPAVGALICGAASRALGRLGTGLVACLSIAGAFLATMVGLFGYEETGSYDTALWTWLEIPVDTWWQGERMLRVDMGALVDPLSLTMLSVVTGVGFLIHWYSVGYMADDSDYGRYFASLNLFVAAMVLLVLANNLVLLLVGWGGVGYASYSLIGFWYQKPAAAAAARKAFVINVLGDIGLMIAIILVALNLGTVSYTEMFRSEFWRLVNTPLLGLLLLLAAYAKSAQLPLHTWLPDAMEGPTPVSALIHAATMVTAGVYLVVRCGAVFREPALMGLLVGAGALTALFAALCATVQNDLKRMLAYSTMSQLGYMFMGAGAGAYGAAMFHLVTHAFFKALLFLSAGMVIHALHGEQDMRRMGGLRKLLPSTAGAFFVGALCLAGIPGLSGFFSKEAILAATYSAGAVELHLLYWAVGLATALITAFYTFRAYRMTFEGDEVVTEHRFHRPSGSMLMPVMVLALLSLSAGAIETVFSPLEDFLHYPYEGHEMTFVLFGVAFVVPLVGMALGLAFGPRVGVSDGELSDVRSGFGFDDFYYRVVVFPLHWLAGLFDRPVEDLFSRLVPRALGNLGLESGQGLSTLQTGSVRQYALWILAGVVALIAYALGTGGGL